MASTEALGLFRAVGRVRFHVTRFLFLPGARARERMDLGGEGFSGDADWAVDSRAGDAGTEGCSVSESESESELESESEEESHGRGRL